MATFPDMQGLAGIVLGDTATSNSSGSTHNATFYGNHPPMQMYPMPSTQRVVEEEMERRMKLKFEDGYEKGLKEAEAKIRANRAKAMRAPPKHTVEYKAKKMEGWNTKVGANALKDCTFGLHQNTCIGYDAGMGLPTGILESGLPKPDEFTQLYNHDFHKLLAKFDALLEN